MMEKSAAAVNILPNPSFEEAQANRVQGWKSRAWAGQANARWRVESPGRTGKHCISIASAQGADAAWTTTVSVNLNAWYRLSGWIKTSDLRGAVGALLNIQNMQAVKTAAISGTQAWTRVSTVFQAAASELEINCLFGGWGTSTGQAWYDDVVLEPIDGGDIPPSGTHAVITIDTQAKAQAYSPMIFGGFLEHFGRQIYGGVFEPGSALADEDGFRRDVIAALKELKAPIVRWPGGCYVSGYHWEAGVGKQREPTDDMAWGVIESNTFGTDEFVKLCRVLGWQPYICNNAGNGTVEEMRNWVEYCNGDTGPYAQMRRDNGHAEPLNVQIWSIGNENWGQHEIGYKPIEQWAPLVRKAARAMKAVDPQIKLSAAAQPSRAWSLPLLKEAGPYLDYISIHAYWLGLWQKNDTPDYLSCIMHSEGPEETIARFIGVLDESGFRGRIKIAFDEWNLRGWHHPGFPRKTVQDYADPEVINLVKEREKNAIASQYTMADALFSASFLNACLRHAEDVGMANIAPIVNTRGPLFVHPTGIVRRTHFHTMAMYVNALEARVGQLDLQAGHLRHGNRSIPVVDAIATVDERGKHWAIAMVNRHPSKDVTCTLNIGEMPLDGSFQATVLTAESPDAYNDIEHPDRVVPKKLKLTFEGGVVDLPPHSLTIVHVPAQTAEESAMIATETVKKWSAPYRGWHYYPDHVIPAKPNIKGFEEVNKTDVPTVFQRPGDRKWYMTFIGFDGKGYQSFVAESEDLIHWTNMRLAMGYGPEGGFDHGGVVLGAFLYEDYDIKAPRMLKQKHGKFFSLYGAYPRQGGYELRPGYEGVACSDNGLTWRRAKDQPILSVHQEDCGTWEKDCIYQPWLLEHQGTYYNFYNAANGSIEQMGLALSQDLLEWKRYEHNPVIPHGPKGSYNERFSSDGKVFWDKDHWVNFFFGVGQGGAHVLAAFSRDLIHWTVDPEPLYKAGGNPSGLDKKYAHKISLLWNPVNETFYMFYNAVGNKGRGIGLITSKPL